MSLLNWIFDIYQHTRIDDARREAAEARAELASVRSGGGGVDAARLQHALEELALATKTLQRMLVEKGVCSAGELAGLIERVDREDGRADGRSPLD